MTYTNQVRCMSPGAPQARHRTAIATLAVGLAILLGGGAALADPGDLMFRRLSGFAGTDLWRGVAAYGSSVYVGGERNESGVLRRYSRSGAVVWTRTIHITGASVVAIHGVAADSSGVYAVGDYLVGDVPHGFVARYRPNATPMWVEPIDLGADSLDRSVSAVAIDTFGSHIYVAGQSYQTDDHSDMTTFVRKLDPDAGTTWTRRVPFDPAGYL